MQCWLSIQNLQAKSGKHGLVSDVSNIAAVLNIPIQLFEHFIGVQFRAHHAGQTFHLKKFDRDVLPSLSFLCTLDSTPAVIDNGHSLKISQLDWSLFKSPRRTVPRVLLTRLRCSIHARKSLRGVLMTRRIKKTCRLQIVAECI
jgi:hypothetical protein